MTQDLLSDPPTESIPSFHLLNGDRANCLVEANKRTVSPRFSLSCTVAS